MYARVCLFITHTHTHISKDSNSKDVYIITNFMHMNQMEKRKIFNLCTWTHVLTKGHWKWHLKCMCYRYFPIENSAIFFLLPLCSILAHSENHDLFSLLHSIFPQYLPFSLFLSLSLSLSLLSLFMPMNQRIGICKQC